MENILGVSSYRPVRPLKADLQVIFRCNYLQIDKIDANIGCIRVPWKSRVGYLKGLSSMQRLLIFCLLCAPYTFVYSDATPNKIVWDAPKTPLAGSTSVTPAIAKHTLKCGLFPGSYIFKKDMSMPAVESPIDFLFPARDGYRYCVVTDTDINGEESLQSSQIRFYTSAATPTPDKTGKTEAQEEMTVVTQQKPVR